MYLNIAIDGPAGAGKSTIAKAVAQALGILYLDTGAMYRAMALKALRAGVDPRDPEAVESLLPDTDIFARNIDGAQHTYLDGEDVSQLLRTQEMARAASDISAIPKVRIKLAQVQRAVAQAGDVVMDGREIGSYVLPDTPHKFFVTASLEERRRRQGTESQAAAKPGGRNRGDIQEEVAQRDYNDSHRAFAPLVQVPDAVVIDTTHMTITQAVDAVLAKLPSKVGGELV